MANPLSARDQAMAFWGVISSAAAGGLSASAVGTLVRAEAIRLGFTPSFEVYTEAARLFGEATALRHSSERMADAPAEAAITSEYISRLPYGNNPSALGGPRAFDVRVSYDAVRFGNTEHSYVTLRYTGGLPSTVGDLRAEAEDIASGLVEGYGASITAIGAISIGEL